jgi:phosphate/sulfate permease
MATAHISSARKPIAKGLDVLRRFPWTLALSAILSLVFVVFVAALIAFMQYQTRLLRSQPGITASQLVYYVETENKIQQEQSELATYSVNISKATRSFTSTGIEIDYRIGRICAMFDVGPNAKADTERCRQFLKRIPFEGTAKVFTTQHNATPDSVASKTSGSPPPVEPISADLLSSIEANFIEVMGPRKFGDVEFSNLVSLFRSDMATIARLNQDYSLNIRPTYLSLLGGYAATCRYLMELSNTVASYRTIDVRCNPQIADTFAASDALPVAEGGMILPTKPISNQSGISQIQPAIDQAVSTGPTPIPSSNNVSVAQQPDSTVEPSTLPAILPNAQRTFELVYHYRFYDRISFGKLRDILISPNDFLALVLVCVGGILGALLRIVFSSYVSGKDPTLRSIVISPILGLICSLVIYNLFRAGFIVITDQPQNSDSATLSPFIIALLAMAAGLLSERTVGFFRKTFDNWLGSVEASEAERWAVNLQREMDAQKTTAEKLAERLDISAAKLKDWVQEKEPVPNDKQREIALALNVPLRRIFTDLEPTRTG